MDIGFTGTQKGMTEKQYQEVHTLLMFTSLITPRAEAHHGLCIGADYHFHRLCRLIGVPVVGHPPINQSKMAAIPEDEFVYLWEPKEYLDRNTDIVNCSTSLIATPGEMVEELRSGTWSTIRKAKKKGIRGIIVYPDGSTEEFGNEKI